MARRLGLARRERLTKAADYRAAFRGGCVVRDGLFTLRARPGGTTAGAARLGLAVSRRVLPKATARNRIKRRIRESFRQRKDMLRGLDIVVLVNAAAAAADSATQRAALDCLWQKIVQQCKRS